MMRWGVYGARSRYVAEVLEIIGRRGEEVTWLVDNLDDGPLQYRGLPTLAPADAERADGVDGVVVPLTTPGMRYVAAIDAEKHGFVVFPQLLDPTAVIASTARVDRGVIVNAGVVIGAGVDLEAFVSINRSASVGHDCHLGAYVSVGPGAVLAGSIWIGRGAFVGVGATILPKVTIGANAVVGGGAVVTRDVPEGATVVGNPARVVKVDGPGDQGVGVPRG